MTLFIMIIINKSKRWKCILKILEMDDLPANIHTKGTMTLNKGTS